MMKFILFISLTLAAATVSGQPPFNKELSALLDTIYKDDQADRLKSDSLQKKYGWESEQLQTLWRKIHIQDSINVIKVKQMIDTYGWPGPDEVGKQGSQTIFLVIQHADSLTQVTYLPVMREAVKKGKAQPGALALLEDRVLINQGKEQVYGSQIRITETGKYEFYPIVDEINVNKRRAAVGLEPLEEYANRFGFKYVLPKSKKIN